MGSLQISLEPAASCVGWRGLTAMNVSLCGPHSLDASALERGDGIAGVGANASGPFCEMYMNLSHHVGSCGDEVCASARLAAASASETTAIQVLMGTSGSENVILQPRPAAAKRVSSS